MEHPSVEYQQATSHRESLSSTSPTHSFQPVYKEPGLVTATRTEIQLSRAVQEILQEVYFTSMFNSTLIFHRPTFQKAFQEKTIPRHLLLAVYASATIFLHSSSPLSRQHANQLQSLGDIRSLGREWALQAGKEVLQDMDRPLFESVQACHVLTSYWFSAGDSMRNTMFLGIAYTAACTLGLDARDSTPPSHELRSGTNPNIDWLDTENRRRCFWAIWFTLCINADHNSMRTSHIDRVLDLSLPIGEASYSQATPQPSRTISTALNESFNVIPRDSGETSIMAELMTLILHWAKIRDLIRAANRVPLKDWLADLFDLEGQLSTWSARLAPSLQYSKRNLYEQLVVNHQPAYIFIHALYHQSRLVLHSSLVPQFSGFQFDQRPPSEATSLSARLALKSTQALSELGADLIALDWDTGQIPAFVGYCMYGSASINIALLYARDSTLAVGARANLISNLKLLKSMKLYWTNLERLWGRVNMLYGTQISRHRATAADGTAAWPSDSETPLSDLDRIAGESRDTGQLAEPLAHSVLEYTLRRLKPSANPDPAAAPNFGRSLYPDDVSQLLSESQNSTIPTITTATQLLPHTSEHNLSNAHHLPQSNGEIWDWIRDPPLLTLQGNGYDFWQSSLDSIQEPIMLYDDFLGLDYSF